MKPQLMILSLAYSALLSSPVIAGSNDLEIRSDNMRVSVDTNDEIELDTGRIQLNVPARRAPYFIDHYRWRVPNFRSYCQGSSRIYQSRQTSQSGDDVRVYTSTSTQVCE